MATSDYCATRLHWLPGRGGCARRDGRSLALSAPPDIGDGPVYSIDYIPACLALISVSVHDCPPRDMSGSERARADALLREIVPSAFGSL